MEIRENLIKFTKAGKIRENPLNRGESRKSGKIWKYTGKSAKSRKMRANQRKCSKSSKIFKNPGKTRNPGNKIGK